MIKTTAGVTLPRDMLLSYLDCIINRFFKILPIKESGELSVDIYIRSLQIELLGCKELILLIHEDPLFLTLISILQYFIDNPDCSLQTVKREVFKAISICNKLKAKYAKPEDNA